MKKLVPLIVLAMLIVSTSVVLANPKNSVYIEWEWPTNDFKSAYFFPTPSGLVHAWTYDHSVYGDSHWVAKPYNEFPNVTMCEEGYLLEHTTWTPQGIYNSLTSTDYQEPYLEIFPELDQQYLLCIYPLE